VKLLGIALPDPPPPSSLLARGGGVIDANILPGVCGTRY
jgi:hypothetical protein